MKHVLLMIHKPKQWKAEVNLLKKLTHHLGWDVTVREESGELQYYVNKEIPITFTFPNDLSGSIIYELIHYLDDFPCDNHVRYVFSDEYPK